MHDSHNPFSPAHATAKSHHPPNLYIRRQTCDDGYRGVWTTEPLAQNSTYGPYDAEIVHLQDETGPSSCIYIHNVSNMAQSTHVQGTRPEWIRFVNSSQHAEECNMYAFELNSRVYYRTLRLVPANTELVVWYEPKNHHPLPNTQGEVQTPVEKLRPKLPATELNNGWQFRDITNTIGNVNASSEKSSGTPQLDMCKSSDHSQMQVEEPLSSSLRSAMTPVPLNPVYLMYACDSCDLRFFSSDQLAVHMKTHRKELTRADAVQGTDDSSCPQLSNLLDPTSQHGGNNELNPFSNAREPTENKQSLIQVMKRSVIRNLLEKRKSELRDMKHICEVCQKPFPDRKGLKSHYQVHQEGKPHRCSECGKSFKRAQYLKTHMRRHTGEKLHFCETCGKSFLQSSDLRIHYRSHTGEKPHVCMYCGNAYTVSGNLNKHIRSQHPEKLV